MALQPSLRPTIIAGSDSSPHTLEVFVDYVCPFSGKIANKIDQILLPWFSSGGKYENKVKLIIRNQVQPWHASSTFTHEASLAVARVAPEAFWKYNIVFFKVQDDFYDIPSSTLTPIQIREKLAQVAAQVIPADKVEAFKDLLVHKTSPNGGVDVTDDLKYTIKYSRQNGIHVSPTVLFDGLITNAESSWGEEEWSKFLESKIKA